MKVHFHGDLEKKSLESVFKFVEEHGYNLRTKQFFHLTDRDIRNYIADLCKKKPIIVAYYFDFDGRLIFQQGLEELWMIYHYKHSIAANSNEPTKFYLTPNGGRDYLDLTYREASNRFQQYVSVIDLTAYTDEKVINEFDKVNIYDGYVFKRSYNENDQFLLHMLAELNNKLMPSKENTNKEIEIALKVIEETLYFHRTTFTDNAVLFYASIHQNYKDMTNGENSYTIHMPVPAESYDTFYNFRFNPDDEEMLEQAEELIAISSIYFGMIPMAVVEEFLDQCKFTNEKSIEIHNKNIESFQRKKEAWLNEEDQEDWY